MRRAARVDANQAEIIAALRTAGASVHIIEVPVDLLVGYMEKTVLIEVKNPKSRYGKQGLNENQAEFLNTWDGGPVAMVDSVDAALQVLKILNTVKPVQ